MRSTFRLVTLGSLAAAAASPAAAADLVLQIDLPRQAAAEYHRPYVAVWLERTDQTPVGTLATWYETDSGDRGERYLKELRQWWRKIGREQGVSADAVSGPTRAPGPQRTRVKGSSAVLAALPPGQYAVVVEAAREAGGRESLRLPLAWPSPRGQTARAAGEAELGAVSLTVR
ncbi:DUF2271 domain-containing protein [Phenylobacterium sp. LjRoot225]|uniref:DUF2271 domain-containing protein n=1 Tax=Phenylobacterium sp. LjRoot225 TaxID=3342285 RepID=UPI003ECCA371